MGINKTISKITERFYWLGIKNDVVKWISECDRCQKSEKIKTIASILIPIKTEGPWQMIGIDLIGPLKESQSGNKYILTLTDLCSKFVEAFAIPSKSADLVCDKLQSVFYRFGPPEKILTDQGKEFCNNLNDKLFSLFFKSSTL